MSTASAKKARPKFLSLYMLLFEFRFPAMGWASGMHRISGTLLFFPFAAWLLYLLDTSLASQQGFDHVRDVYLGHPLAKLGLLVLIWAYAHHFCAGIRCLFIDLNRGVDLPHARISAYAVFAAAIVLTALFGWLILW
jgi:succinate dehydrogenase / fumarate reductase cytochrome b subunit